MTGESKPCQFVYKDMVLVTNPDDRLALPLRRYWWTLKRLVWYFSILGPAKFARRMLMSKPLGLSASRSLQGKANMTSGTETLNLQPGELVEVRSVKEIFATLNKHGKLKGLRFTPEMVKFCGRRFKVYKRLEKIILEATGELRRIRTPTVLLEGVLCDGEAHGGCERSCFCFWREAWLKRVRP